MRYSILVILFVFKLALKNLEKDLTKCREITGILLVTDIETSKNRYLKRRYDTILILSMSALCQDIFYIYRPTSSSRAFQCLLACVICCHPVDIPACYGMDIFGLLIIINVPKTVFYGQLVSHVINSHHFINRS